MSEELVPGLGASLARRAQERAEARSGRRRHRFKVGFATLGAVALLSSGAYAARGLWQPELGQPNDTVAERPVADDAPPAELALRHLAPLRREQNDADRGTASQAALQISAARMKVLTNSVRRLGEVPGVGTVVLVPMKRARSGEHVLCVAVDGGKGLESRSRVCSNVERFLDGGVVFGIGVPLPAELEEKLAASRREQAELRRDQRKEQPQQHQDGNGHYTVFTTPPVLVDQLVAEAKLDVIGIVPDGVAQVRLTKDGQTFPVNENLFHGRVREADSGTLAPTFLDANGTPLPPLVAPKPVEPPTAADFGRLGVGLGRVAPALQFHIREIGPGLVRACTVIRARPRTTEDEQRRAVNAALAPVTGELSGDRLAMATEALRGVWCLRPYR